jgi:hypothetical protein
MFDPTEWINALLLNIGALMAAGLDALTNLLSGRAETTWQQVGSSLVTSDFNFITQTPGNLSYNLGGVADLYRQWDPLLVSAIAVSIFAAGLSAVGREYFAWSWHPGEWASRLTIGILCAVSTMHIYMITIDLTNALCRLISTAGLPGQTEGDFDPIALLVIVLMWIVLGMRVAVRMAYRLIYLDVLLVLGPLAMMSWVIPKGQPYAAYWTRTFVGLLIGQIGVCACFRLAQQIATPFGANWGGIAIAAGALLLAYDMATMFTDIKGGGLAGAVRGATTALAFLF